MSSTKGTFGVTGIPPPADVEYRTDPSNNIPYVTGMPLRYEITAFFEDMSKKSDPVKQKQWTLFVEALTRFKALSVDERLSYFQVAGIHGSPETPWDGAKAPNPEPTNPLPGENPFGGYCHHNTVAFPTWHRPYMLLYEQCIWLNMEAVIKDWVDSNVLSPADALEWSSAASGWRLFYWDWAKKQEYPNDVTPGGKAPWKDFGIPYLFASPFVPTFPPHKNTVQVPNPLWNFDNPEKDPDTGNPLPFGQMPKGKEQWNIPNDPKKPDPEKPWQVPLPWASCTGTSRWGILYDDKAKKYSGLEGKNVVESCNIALSTAGQRWYKPRRGSDTMSKPDWKETPKPGNLADSVNRMFSVNYNDKWTTFASTKWYAEQHADKYADNTTGYLSLEYIHNNIHNITGGSSLGLHVGDDPSEPSDPDPSGIYGAGQMCDVPVAAFDPIFWMHHCNIDRYTAMWQCLNWDKWFEKEPPPSGGRPQVEDVKPDDPLDPFHLTDGGDPNDRNNRWTSEHGRDWTKRGYQYDDLMPNPGAIDPATGKLIADIYKLDLQEYIHTTYPGTSYQAYAIKKAASIENADYFGPNTTDQGAFEDYIINVIYDRYALNGASYAIEFSIDGDYVGQIYSLGGLKPGTEVGCANCGTQKTAGILSKGQVPISIPIMRKAADTSFKAITTIQEKDVEDYLADNLSVQYIGAGGRIVPTSQFPDTKITVLAGKAIWSEDKKDNAKSAWRPPYYIKDSYRPLPRATAHLRGGLKEPSGGFLGSTPLDEVEVPDQAPKP